MTVRARNPRTGQIDYRVDPPDRAAIAAMCGALRDAQSAWSRASIAHRVKALTAWRDVLASDRAIVEALSVDTGRRPESELEAQVVLASVDRWCGLAADLLAARPRRRSSLPFVDVVSDAAPYPLVGVISPWNFPLLLSVIDAIPALLAGCAVVVKPSEITPRFIEPMRAAIERIPELAAVLRYVPGAGDTGRAIVDHVDLVCFTGSVATGRLVGEQCGRRLIPAYLELGGKDAAIVTASADVDRATSALLWGSVVNAGQSCLSIERIYVDDRVREAFTAMLVDKARAVGVAAPDHAAGQLGPIISEPQAHIIADHIADARARGARALCGGEIENHGGGLYCAPTVLTDVDHTMRVMRDETFGPIMPVMGFGDLDQATNLANDTQYGLSGAVFAGDEDEALAIARRMEAGAISIRDAGLTAMVHDAEKTAFKHSGVGPSRMGPAALQRFLRRKVLLINTSAAPDPWWF